MTHRHAVSDPREFTNEGIPQGSANLVDLQEGGDDIRWEKLIIVHVFPKTLSKYLVHGFWGKDKRCHGENAVFFLTRNSIPSYSLPVSVWEESNVGCTGIGQ